MQLKRIALILPLLMGGLYASELNVTTDVIVENLTIESGDKMILSTGITLTVNGNLVITGELEMADSSIVDAGGNVTVAAGGTLDMIGTARLKMEGDQTFGGTLVASAASRIELDGSLTQTIAGTATPVFNRLFCSSSATVFNLTATINDTLDAGGGAFTISDGKTLTMDAGSVTVISGGSWTRTGTLTLDAASKVLYTTGANSTMTPKRTAMWNIMGAP